LRKGEARKETKLSRVDEVILFSDSDVLREYPEMEYIIARYMTIRQIHNFFIDD
jgi:hypothetical protein